MPHSLSPYACPTPRSSIADFTADPSTHKPRKRSKRLSLSRNTRPATPKKLAAHEAFFNLHFTRRLFPTARHQKDKSKKQPICDFACITFCIARSQANPNPCKSLFFVWKRSTHPLMIWYYSKPKFKIPSTDTERKSWTRQPKYF